MARFKGTYSASMGTRRMIATQDPGFIEHVLKSNHRNYHKSPLTEQLAKFVGKGLLTSNGEYWLKQRRLIQPGFHLEKIQALYAIIERTVDHFLDRFPTGDKVDVYPLMNGFAFEIVVNTLFNIEVPPSTRNELSRFITETQDFVIRKIRQPYKSWWFELSGEVRSNLRKAESARNIIGSIIRTRKNSGQKFNDLLDMLLDARYEDTGLPMDEAQVVDEILILLIAGHETTANALSWILYLLSRHPHQQNQLREATRDLVAQDAVRSEWLNALINESMRLYPPAWISDRIALKADQYDDFSFPENTIVILFFYGLHRDPKYWDDADAFMPQRFLKPQEARDKPKAYYPFGAGPRLCIGNNFAMAEMTIFLQAMIQRFDIRPTNQEPVKTPLVTLRPDRVLLNLRGI